MIFIKNAFDFLCNLIFPTTCGICGKLGENICASCYKEIEKHKIKTNIRTRRFHLFRYEGIIRDKIIQYKFLEKSYLHSMFCDIIINDKSACEFIKSYDIIIPVPIHKKRKKSRGYNQCELIVQKIADKSNIIVEKDVLVKIKNNISQSTLRREERLSNLYNVYIVKNQQKILNKSVLIFDDIYTTGTTSNECRKVLEQSGAKKVGIFTIAKD